MNLCNDNIGLFFDHFILNSVKCRELLEWFQQNGCMIHNRTLVNDYLRKHVDERVNRQQEGTLSRSANLSPLDFIL